MDAWDLFKKLSAGTRFDKNRFQSDAKRFQLNNPNNHERKVQIKTEPEDFDFTSKRKREDEEINASDKEYDESNDEKSLTLLHGISVSINGRKVKRKKQKLMTEGKILLQEQEKVNHFRNVHHISIVGRNVPKPIENFTELSQSYNIDQDLLENIHKCGYSTPTPIQMQALPILLKNRQTLACAPTGSGKTVAFLLPIIHHLQGPRKQGFRAIILSPTRELAKQTYRECVRLSEGRGFRVHIISKIKQALEKYGPRSSQKFDILITTPKRLLFLLNQEPSAISLKNVQWMIIDEADKLFEDGPRSFRAQLEQISKACTHEDLHRAMFSATNTPVVTKWCRHNLKGLIAVTIGHRNAATDLVEQELLFVGSERGKLVAFRNIINKGMPPPVLVFVQSKERAQELFNELIYDGINVDVIHADRTQTQRDNVVRCFREGKIWVLICTELMSRGIDFKGVNLVINYDFPPSAISYVHRIGRTGRAGHKGKAVTFFTEQDTTNLRSIATIMRASGCEVPDYMLAMKRHSKKEKRKIERSAPKRDTISTIPKFKRKGQNKGSKSSERSETSETKDFNKQIKQSVPSKERFANKKKILNKDKKMASKLSKSSNANKNKAIKSGRIVKKLKKQTNI